MNRGHNHATNILGIFASLLILLASAGCDSGGSLTSTPTTVPSEQDATVQPLEAILSKGPVFSDPLPNSVTVLIDTSVPVVCAAAYGTTTEYGQLATDSDMAGGAHQNHHPLLSGLQPDTDYHVRLQGVGPDGTLYRSQDYTFHTPKGDAAGTQPETRPTGTNLALLSGGAKIAGVSSNYGGDNTSSFGANNAFDGNPATQWSSNGDGDKAWIEVELPTSAHITGIGFWSRTMGTSAEIRTFKVIADSGQSYGPFTLSDAGSIHYFSTDFTAQRLRFEAVETSGGNTGAVEIEVYGTP
ncbi:MAG TPA: discoidin domain-containing protein [Chloroflexia bacterium]|nr:discoidin domain-containing protein [Chloroflexia bacterium]